MKGANKLFLVILALLLIIPVAFSAVKIEGFVNDYAAVLNTEEKQEIYGIAQQIYDSGEAQYAVVIVNSLEGKAIESYSLELAQGNLGDSEKNNGLLLLISIEDRKYRFEVGRGLEYILNDAKVGRIGRTYLVPNFQAGNYGNGVLESSLAVRSILLGENESAYYVTGEEPYYDYESIFTVAFFLLFFILLPLLGAIFSKNKSKNKYFNAAMGAVILFGGRGGGRGGFGGSGGFGGFGGGGFGGGGAGGRW